MFHLLGATLQDPVTTLINPFPSAVRYRLSDSQYILEKFQNIDTVCGLSVSIP
jgi:hypothetical protein